MTAVSIDDTAEQIVSLATSTGYSRFPVIGRDRDDVLGVLHVKQAFAVALDDRAAVTAADLMIEPLRVPESMGVDTLLDLLRKQGLQVAIVSDEHGGTAGIVTLEDLVEEIVGELEDEHDRARVGVVRTGRSITFDASLRPDELLDRTGIAVPDGEEYDTIAGFVTDQLDRLPELGDEVDGRRRHAAGGARGGHPRGAAPLHPGRIAGSTAKRRTTASSTTSRGS